MANLKKSDQNDNTLVILEKSCKSISGKSELVLNLGTDENEQLMLRIKSNSGSGLFSSRWVPVQAVIEKLHNSDSDGGLTSFAFKGLTGKSANDPGFLAAALKALGLLIPMEGKQRRFVAGDVDTFLREANQLRSGKKLTASPRAKANRKPAAKTASAPASNTTRKSPGPSRKGK